MSASLDLAEWARDARFVEGNARREFVFARVFLRKLLAGCLQVDSAALEIGTQAGGKPSLGHSGWTEICASTFPTPEGGC